MFGVGQLVRSKAGEPGVYEVVRVCRGDAHVDAEFWPLQSATPLTPMPPRGVNACNVTNKTSAPAEHVSSQHLVLLRHKRRWRMGGL